jgi:hypothetical protein
MEAPLTLERVAGATTEPAVESLCEDTSDFLVALKDAIPTEKLAEILDKLGYIPNP